MNIFQQVFASVNPRSVDALHKTENSSQNRSSLTPPKKETQTIEKKVDVAPKKERNASKSLTRVALQKQVNPPSPRKRQSLARQLEIMKKKREVDVECEEEEE